MSLKVTGAEWKKFYDDDTVWAGEAYDSLDAHKNQDGETP